MLHFYGPLISLLAVTHFYNAAHFFGPCGPCVCLCMYVSVILHLFHMLFSQKYVGIIALKPPTRICATTRTEKCIWSEAKYMLCIWPINNVVWVYSELKTNSGIQRESYSEFGFSMFLSRISKSLSVFHWWSSSFTHF